MFPRIDEGHCSETSISWPKRQDGKALSIYFTDRLKVLTAQSITQAIFEFEERHPKGRLFHSHPLKYLLPDQAIPTTLQQQIWRVRG